MASVEIVGEEVHESSASQWQSAQMQWQPLAKCSGGQRLLGAVTINGEALGWLRVVLRGALGHGGGASLRYPVGGAQKWYSGGEG